MNDSIKSPNRKTNSLAEVYDIRKFEFDNRIEGFVYKNRRISLTPLPTNVLQSPMSSKYPKTPKARLGTRLKRHSKDPKPASESNASRGLASRFGLLLKNDHYLLKTMHKEKKAEFEKSSPPDI